MARKSSTAQTVEPATVAEVRAWATSEGLTIASRGRLSAAVREQFTSATGRPIAG